MADNAPVFNNRHLRFVFVAFLFSAAIADVGRGAVKVFSHWPLFPPAATHLMVAFLAISTSWVYWARNIGDGPQLKEIFSREYLLLVLDLVLVIIYIGIAQSVELPDPDPTKPIPTPSAVPESVLLALVYFLYFFWDLLHDVWIRRGNAAALAETMVGQNANSPTATELRADVVPDGAVANDANAQPTVDPQELVAAPVNSASASGGTGPPTTAQTLAAAAVRAGASLACCALALLIVTTARSRNVTWNSGVCALNVAELGNLVLFRSLKAFEHRFNSSLHVAYQEPIDRYAEVRRKMVVSSIASATAYACCLLYVQYF